MQVSYIFRNYLQKTGLITYQDFSRVSEESSKNSIISLSQVLEAQVRLNPLGNTHSELSHRIYNSFYTSYQEKALAASLNIKAITEARTKLRSFMKWSSLTSPLISFSKDNSRPRSSSKSNRSHSLSVKSEAKQLLSSFSSKPLVHSKLNSSFNNTQKSNSPFNRLYDHAASKEISQEKNRNEAIQREMEECTFRPKVRIEGERPGNVFERLHYVSGKDSGAKFKEEKEMLECTFTPKINPPKSREKVFEKICNEVENKKKKGQDIRSDDVHYTFRPSPNGETGKVTVGNVYEKLYLNFQEIQKEREKKQGKLAEVQFVTKTCMDVENTGKYSKLYEEVERKKIKEKPRSNSATRKTDEVPRFEYLYALHKDKQERNIVLQEKFLKDSGAVFKPDLKKTSPSNKRQETMSKMSYPVPKPPAESFYN